MATPKMATVAEHFSSLTDPRCPYLIHHKLIDIIILTICAVICGADDFGAVTEYGRLKERWLRRFLELPHGIPSDDTLRRVFAMVSTEEFERCFISWIQAVFTQTKGQVIAIDGKRVRRSYTAGDPQTAIHVVNAWACANGIVLGQRKTEDKSNEITAIPALLDLLDISGCIVTIDAMGCQAAIAAKIIAKEADYVLAVKDNQPTLHEDVRKFFAAPERRKDRALKRWRPMAEKDHGRIEERVFRVAPAPPWTGGATEWPGLASVVEVTATRTDVRTDATTTETRYYISSVPANQVERLAAAVRRHWAIENGVHWVLDTAFGEDQSRLRIAHAAANFALVRRLSLSLLKGEKSAKIGVANKRLAAGWNDAYLFKVLTACG